MNGDTEQDRKLTERLVEMLLAGMPADAIFAGVINAGRPATELVPALASAQRQLRSWRQRRDETREHALWISEVMRACQNGPPVVPVSARIECEVFYREYFAENRPVLFGDVWYDGDVPHVSFDSLRERYGSAMIEITTRRVRGTSDFVDLDAHREAVVFEQFLDDVESLVTNEFYLTSHNMAVQGPLGDFVQTLRAFPDFMDQRRPLESALFIGPRGAISPLHYDRGNVMLVELLGTKRVTLYSPYDECFLYHDDSGLSSPVDPNSPDLERFPLSRFARPAVVDVLPGTALFLPVGWWHHVESLTPTCSLSMSNFAAVNYFGNVLL